MTQKQLLILSVSILLGFVLVGIVIGMVIYNHNKNNSNNTPVVKETMKQSTKDYFPNAFEPNTKNYYHVGYIEEDRHCNTNQCYNKQDVKLSSYYNKPTEMKPVPTMGPNYQDKQIPDNDPSIQFVLPI